MLGWPLLAFTQPLIFTGFSKPGITPHHAYTWWFISLRSMGHKIGDVHLYWRVALRAHWQFEVKIQQAIIEFFHSLTMSVYWQWKEALCGKNEWKLENIQSSLLKLEHYHISSLAILISQLYTESKRFSFSVQLQMTSRRFIKMMLPLQSLKSDYSIWTYKQT